MTIDSYPLSSSPDRLTYYFNNVGEEVTYPSAIVYVPIYDKHPNTYNLAFGVVSRTELGGRVWYTIDDTVVTDNQNRDTVLATVIKSIFKFWEMYPGRSVFITGSTPARTRMYRGIIGNYGHEMSEYAKFYGVAGQIKYPFQPNMNYEGFIIEPLMDN